MRIILPMMLLGLITVSSCTNETPTEEVVSTKYTLAENSIIEWKGIKSKSYFHTGTLNIKSGEITTIDDSLVNGRFIIDMLSIKATGMEEEEAKSLENHLMGLDSNEHHKPNDFFNAEVYSTVTVNLLGYDGSLLNIDLDMMGKTIQKSVPVSIEYSNNKAMISGEFGIDFDELNIPGLLPNPETGKKKTIELKLDLVLNKK